jgi:hypothetical protein
MESGAPLLVGHLVDGYILRGPNAVIGNENVEASEVLDRIGDQGASGIRPVEAAGDGTAVRLAAFFRQSIGLRLRLLVAEYDLRTRCGEHTNRSCSDAAGATCDQSYFAGEREMHSF